MPALLLLLLTESESGIICKLNRNKGLFRIYFQGRPGGFSVFWVIFFHIKHFGCECCHVLFFTLHTSGKYSEEEITWQGVFTDKTSRLTFSEVLP